eukprot:TRINITY_DN33345_c0_g1_i1.p1 TRINITY_DN33345_c0_g1~~TRINITY_DN33345_c0_g1_i1.p1  ORF type:complete len:273 (+),score=76.26 TRINITY_DN33345_c0_g1_i1:65-883(+)
MKRERAAADDPAFAQRKGEVLRSLQQSGDDRSPKGSVDERCLPVIEVLNAHDDYVSLSSCSGRVALWEELAGGAEGDEERRKRGAGGWVWLSHDRPDVPAAVAAAEAWTGTGVLWLRFEPYILHVQARSQSAARKLTAAAIAAGFRNSGCVIGGTQARPSYVVAARTTSGFAAPVAGEGLPPCGGQQVEWLLRAAAERLEKTWAQAAGLLRLIAQIPTDAAEEAAAGPDAEERWRRRHEEGLRRQQEMRAAASAPAAGSPAHEPDHPDLFDD